VSRALQTFLQDFVVSISAHDRPRPPSPSERKDESRLSGFVAFRRDPSNSLLNLRMDFAALQKIAPAKSVTLDST